MFFTETNFLFGAFGIYLFTAIVFLLVGWFRMERLLHTGIICFLLASLLHTIALALRILSIGRLPVTSMYEFVLVFSWVMAVLYLAACTRYKFFIAGVVIAPLETCWLAYALLANSSVQPLVPALQSIWLQIHVALALLAYAFFALSFAAAVLKLLQKEDFFFPAYKLDQLIHNTIAIGFPFMTLVLVTGAVWAEQVWGTWWGWDPKETWALITWLIYAVYLHFRKTQQWNPKIAAWMSIIGFAVVIFTLFGVTCIMPGLHSY